MKVLDNFFIPYSENKLLYSTLVSKYLPLLNGPCIDLLCNLHFKFIIITNSLLSLGDLMLPSVCMSLPLSFLN